MTDTALIEEMRKAKVRLKGISLGSEMDICVVEHSTVLIDLAIAALEQSQWASVETVPEDSQLVDMFHEEWIDEDFNPEGIRQGFYIENDYWTSAEWNGDQGCWENSLDSPQKWKPITPPTQESDT